MEISNRTLVWLVVATIAVSIIGSLLSISTLNDKGVTGYAATSNTTGNATVYIAQLTQLDFAVGALDFGNGYVNTSNGATNCTLISGPASVTKENASSCVGFSTGAGLRLENEGNTFMSVTLNFSVNDTTLFGSSAQKYLGFNFSAYEAGSCIGATTNSTWQRVQVPNVTLTTICSNLSWLDASDTLSIGLTIAIPADASGQKTVTINAQGTAI